MLEVGIVGMRGPKEAAAGAAGDHGWSWARQVKKKGA